MLHPDNTHTNPQAWPPQFNHPPGCQLMTSMRKETAIHLLKAASATYNHTTLVASPQVKMAQGKARGHAEYGTGHDASLHASPQFTRATRQACQSKPSIAIGKRGIGGQAEYETGLDLGLQPVLKLLIDTAAEYGLPAFRSVVQDAFTLI
eukprot:1160271-Pelagomonas_calceolata.AAC.3